MTMSTHITVCMGQGTMPPRTNRLGFFSVIMEEVSVDKCSLNCTVYHTKWWVYLLQLLRLFDLNWKS